MLIEFSVHIPHKRIAGIGKPCGNQAVIPVGKNRAVLGIDQKCLRIFHLNKTVYDNADALQGQIC